MGENNRGETHVRIAKHRNGSLETIKLRALLHIQKFVEDDGEILVLLGYQATGNQSKMMTDQSSTYKREANE
jgi:hypothetical protein